MHVGVIEGGDISLKQEIPGFEYDVVELERYRKFVLVVIAEDAVLTCQQYAFGTDYAVYFTQHDKSSFRYYLPDVGDGTVGYNGQSNVRSHPQTAQSVFCQYIESLAFKSAAYGALGYGQTIDSPQ